MKSLQETAQLSSKVDVPFCTPTGSEGEFPRLHMFVSVFNFSPSRGCIDTIGCCVTWFLRRWHWINIWWTWTRKPQRLTKIWFQGLIFFSFLYVNCIKRKCCFLGAWEDVTITLETCKNGTDRPLCRAGIRETDAENGHVEMSRGETVGCIGRLGLTCIHCYCRLLLSHFSHVQLCATPSLGFSRQEHWSGLPFPSPMHKSEKWKWIIYTHI